MPNPVKIVAALVARRPGRCLAFADGDGRAAILSSAGLQTSRTPCLRDT
jgi:hypothetical protein